jgi:hypothetical protein
MFIFAIFPIFIPHGNSGVDLFKYAMRNRDAVGIDDLKATHLTPKLQAIKLKARLHEFAWQRRHGERARCRGLSARGARCRKGANSPSRLLTLAMHEIKKRLLLRW